MAFIAMTLAGIALWPAIRGGDLAKKALDLARWTALKDYKEQCQNLLVCAQFNKIILGEKLSHSPRLLEKIQQIASKLLQ